MSGEIWFTNELDAKSVFCPVKQGKGLHLKYAKRYGKGEYIYTEGDQANKIFFIDEGRVKIAKQGEEGREIIKAILDEGEIFGELIGSQSTQERKDYAIAMTEVQVCAMTEEEMKSMLREPGPFLNFMMKIFQSRALKMEKRLENLIFKDSRSRVIAYLVDLVEEKGDRVGYEWVVRKFLKHQDIANLTATSRQTVTTVLNDLRKQSLIKFDRRRLLIRDLEALKDLTS